MGIFGGSRRFLWRWGRNKTTIKFITRKGDLSIRQKKEDHNPYKETERSPRTRWTQSQKNKDTVRYVEKREKTSTPPRTKNCFANIEKKRLSRSSAGRKSSFYKKNTGRGALGNPARVRRSTRQVKAPGRAPFGGVGAGDRNGRRGEGLEYARRVFPSGESGNSLPPSAQP